MVKKPVRASYARRDNMRAIYCENKNGATLQTLFSGPRPFG
jgi:hypothetical protein